MSEARPDLSKAVHKYFATTVGLLTSYGEPWGANVMACEWTMNVCWEPLRIICLVHHEDLTHELISASGEFGVNLCSDQQAGMAHLAGNVTGRKYRKLEDALFAGATYSASRIKAPMIKGCVLNVECVVERTFDLGEYTGFLGLSVETSLNPELRPLIYHQGKFFSLGGQLPKAPAPPA